MSEGLDGERKRQLEEERDFLLQSLDDLELEHDSGGIDDESYAQLHDDYTARAAAAIRALRDGVDARPEPPRAAGRSRRRVVVVAGVVVFALVVGVLLSQRGGRAPPRPDVVGQHERGAVHHERLDEGARGQDQGPRGEDERLARRLRAPAPAGAGLRGERRPPQRAQAVRRRDHHRRQPSRGPRQRGASPVSRVGAGADEGGPGSSSCPRRSPVSTRRSRSAPTTPTRSTSAGSSTRSPCRTSRAAQVDLQNYLVKAPTGQWAAQARQLLAQVTTELESPSTTVPPTTTRPKKK